MDKFRRDTATNQQDMGNIYGRYNSRSAGYGEQLEIQQTNMIWGTFRRDRAIDQHDMGNILER